jgi:signal transduction histidine kinase
MRLSDFILENLEPVLAEWEAFARSLPPGEEMSSKALRQDAERMLRAIAADMDLAQSDGERAKKPRGQLEPRTPDRISAAHDIGFHRQSEGFNLQHVVAEYQMLRASVIRLWSQSLPKSEIAPNAELVRFNEALDQMLAESVQRFMRGMDRSRELLLAVLGHDLRNPLSAIAMSAEVLAKDPSLSEVQHRRARMIVDSAHRMRKMTLDLLDFTRTRLGASLPLQCERCDLFLLGHTIVNEAKASPPDQSLWIDCIGNGEGYWDPQRVEQLAANLLANAIEHGDRDSEVRVTISGEPDYVTLAVHNQGPAVPPSQQRMIFDPFSRAAGGSQRMPASGSLGLGLYIAKQIAAAHGGTIEVTSSDESGTTFQARLPRTPKGAESTSKGA